MTLLLGQVRLRLAEFTLELDLELRGAVTAVFGPSGSGKTSLLDLVAGLRQADSAFIQLDESLLTDTRNRISVPARQRGIGYVPQDLALFPHLSVRGNLLYGQRSGAERRFSLERIVELLEIGTLVQRTIGQLSGGEKQRVALARALLSSPRLLLLDEPLANLDLPLKGRILPYLARIRDEFRIPMLYVTHDRYEALSLADEMVVLSAGRVVQSGPIQEVFARPANLAAAGILTIETIQPGRIVEVADGLATVAVGEATLLALEPGLPAGTKDVHVCIRAEDVILVEGVHGGSARNRLAATVRSISGDGALVRVDLDCGFPLAAVLTKQAREELALKPGDRLLAWVKAPNVHLIAR